MAQISEYMKAWAGGEKKAGAASDTGEVSIFNMIAGVERVAKPKV